MQIPCPHCKKNFDLKRDKLSSGVANTTCPHCGLEFIVRLGKPADAQQNEIQKGKSPKSWRSSGTSPDIVGMIGTQEIKFIPADTASSVVIDPKLLGEVGADDNAKTQRIPNIVEGAAADEAKTQKIPIITEDLTGDEAKTQRIPVIDAISSIDQGWDFDEKNEESSNKEVKQDSSSVYEDFAHALKTPLPKELGFPVVKKDSTLEKESGSAPATVEDLKTSSQSQDANNSSLQQAEQKPVLQYPQPFALSPQTEQGSMVGQQNSYSENLFETDSVDLFLAQPHQSKATRIIGFLISIVLVLGAVFALYVLYQNDWALDPSNFDKMLDRAFGNSSSERKEFMGLYISKPTVQEAKLKDGQKVLTATGVITNNSAISRQFIYVRAIIKRGTFPVSEGEGPAGNIFPAEKLENLTITSLESHLNPAGQKGENVKIDQGKTVPYMVVITNIPQDYNSAEYYVTTEISRVENYNPTL